MKSYIRSLAVLAGLTMLASGVSHAAGLAKSGYWERVMTQTNVGASSVNTVKTYWSGNRKRNEQYSLSGTLVEIKDGNTVYVFKLGGHTALKTTIPEKMSTSVQQELGALAAKARPDKSARKVGTGSVAGLPCNVYQVSGKSGAKAKVYVSTNPQFPMAVKAEITGGHARQITDTKQIKLNYRVPDSMFSLPRGMKVEVRSFKAQTPGGKPAPGNK